MIRRWLTFLLRLHCPYEAPSSTVTSLQERRQFVRSQQDMDARLARLRYRAELAARQRRHKEDE